MAATPEIAEPADHGGRKFTTAEAARFCNTTFHTIVYSTGNGLIEPVEKTDGGTMVFAEEDLRKLAKIKGWEIAEE